MTHRELEFLREFRLHSRPGVVDWLTNNIRIPKTMSPAMVKGHSIPFSIRGQGFARYILETVNPTSGVTDVTNCGATQVFKTYGMCMLIAYRIVHSPMPMLVVFPSKETAQKAVSQKKLQPLIDINPALAARKPSNPDEFTLMEMAMAGGSIRLTGANSPANLAGTSEALIFQDECCKFEHHQSEDSPESHPMQLADERASSFGNDAYRYKSSSPNHVLHPFWVNYEAGSRTHFLVACPNCSHRFPFEDFPDSFHDSTHIGFEKCGPDFRALRWDQDARDAKGTWDEQRVKQSTRYHCPACDFPIREDQRLPMLDDVVEHHLNPSAAQRHRSYRLPKFYTLAQTFGDIAWNRLKPGDLFGNLQHHNNSWLALPWQDIRANIKQEDVEKVRDASHYYRGTIPRTPIALVVGADVGDYKQHWAVGAIYADDSIDVIDWGTCISIDDLIALRHHRYKVLATGEELSPTSGLVDSKDNTLAVFSMCRRSAGFWFPARGSDGATGTWGVTMGDYQRPDLYTFSTHQFKKALYVHSIKERRTPLFSIPRNSDAELLRGLSGQQLVTVGHRDEFKRIPHDHYGDACLRLILARLILRARMGEGAPDMPSSP